MDDTVDTSIHVAAEKRFIFRYRKAWSRLQDDEIDRRGRIREPAMAIYDCERENIAFSEVLLNGRNDDVRAFLSAGIAVIRYCLSASNCERML